MKIPYIRALLPIIMGIVLSQNGCAKPYQLNQVPHTLKDFVWPALLIFVGLAWEMSLSGKTTVDMGFIVLIGALYWWFTFWCSGDHPSQKPKADMVLLLVAATSAVLIWITAKHNPRVSLLLLPLIAWVIFAEHLPKIPPTIRLPFMTIDMPHYTDGNITFTGF
jgi:tryptophan-rich sensory protein